MNVRKQLEIDDDKSDQQPVVDFGLLRLVYLMPLEEHSTEISLKKKPCVAEASLLYFSTLPRIYRIFAFFLFPVNHAEIFKYKIVFNYKLIK